MQFSYSALDATRGSLDAAARELEEGGSFTLFATVDAGGAVSRAVGDIATAEIRLDAELARTSPWPALDLRGTTTLRADRLQTPAEAHLAARARAAGSLDAARALLDKQPAAGE